MVRMLLKIFLIYSLSFSGLCGVFCCGPYFGFPEDTLSFFESSVAGDPFFYPYMLKHSQPYGLTVIEDVKEKSFFDEEIVLANEWRDYFAKNYKEKVDVEAVRSMLFDDTEKTANYVKKLLKINFNSDEMLKNAAITVINSNNDRLTLEYLNFMFEINSLFSKIYDRYSWEEVEEPEKKKETVSLNDLLEYARNKLKDMKNDFLYLRYSYQVIKILAYFEDFDEVISFYNARVAGIKSSQLIKLRCLGYRAMAYYRNDNLTGALNDYLFIFDQSAALMESVRLSLDSMNLDDKIWIGYIEKDDNKSRRINAYFLWMLKDERRLPFDIMEKMSNLNSASSKPEVLLVRSLQAIEKYFPKGRDFSSYVKSCERISRLDKVRQPGLWLIAGSYMSLLNDKINDAERLFNLAVSVKNKNETLISQINLIGSLIEFRKNDFKLNPVIEKDFIRDIAWAKTLNVDNKNNAGIYHSILAHIGNKFLEKGDIPNSVMCYLLCGGQYGFIDKEVFLTEYMDYSAAQYMLDVFASDEGLTYIEDVFKGNVKFELFSIFKDSSSLKLNDIILLRGIKEFRKENFSAASVHFKKLPPDYRQVNFSRSNPEIDHNAKYEKMELAAFSGIMERIKASLSIKKDDSSKYFEMGNIYYTVEMLGFPDIARRKKRSWGAEGIYNKTHSYYFNEMTLYAKSKKYKQEKYGEFIRSADNFLKAEGNYARIVELDNNRELAAKSCILINTCRNNYLYILNEDDAFTNPIDFKKPDKNKMKYFLLFKNYKNTSFYDNFIKECPLIEEFD